ncbi:hypothetical protein [Paenibacillus fonticola]|uniref:hypothetical protein n=1 Tax=Paenibacillus fonticola TaxID=379896 RepID=UPI00146BA0C7|nr:hypothetical protein [Paenibacillus fonticola]
MNLVNLIFELESPVASPFMINLVTSSSYEATNKMMQLEELQYEKGKSMEQSIGEFNAYIFTFAHLYSTYFCIFNIKGQK